jgi:CubicO group peptidase (beta-lactamase class C family)
VTPPFSGRGVRQRERLGDGRRLPWADDGTAAGSSVFGMAGAGGSWAGADPERGLALAVTKNMLTNDFDAVGRVGRVVFGAV